jgi:flagellin
MAITINTNLSSQIVQANLNKSTNALNQAIERMTTGYKINHASDNAAGYSIARSWEAKLGSLDVAADNAATGADMLSTLEDHYALISTHIQRIRDLAEQAANGTYGTQSKEAIQSEIMARLEEVDRIAANCEFGGVNLMTGMDADIYLQVGLDSDMDKSGIKLEKTLFDKGSISALFSDIKYDGGGDIIAAESYEIAEGAAGRTLIAQKCAGLDPSTGAAELHTSAKKETAADMLVRIDNVINKISSRVTTLGAARNRVDSAIESIAVQSENITSSLSTLRDADVAQESSNFLKAQILQQASATLLATANQSPSIALNLL